MKLTAQPGISKGNLEGIIISSTETIDRSWIPKLYSPPRFRITGTVFCGIRNGRLN